MKLSTERMVVAMVISTIFMFSIVQGAALLLRNTLNLPDPAAAIDLALAIIFVGLVSLVFYFFSKKTNVFLSAAFVCTILAAVLIGIVHHSFIAAVGVILVCGPLQAYGALWIAKYLPLSFDGNWQQHRTLSVLWVLLALFAIVHTARLSVYMGDDTQRWCAIYPWDDHSAKHMCLPAYLQPIELHERGVANIYHVDFYKGMNPEADTHSEIHGMEAYSEDIFQYPPPFLLLPKLALRLTNDYHTIRTGWYVIQTISVFIIFAFLLYWIKELNTPRASFFILIFWIAPITALNFQHGQFQLMAYILSIAGMLAFEARRPILGGALLAFAIAGKVFPGILLLLLLFQKKWRDAAWTIGFILGYTVFALLVFGIEPFMAFFTYQLPRLLSGKAIDFFTKTPEEYLALIGTNNSLYAFTQQMIALGFPYMTRAVIAVLGWIYTLLLVGLTAWSAGSKSMRLPQAFIWFSLLNLAVLRSPAGWLGYAHACGQLVHCGFTYV